MKLALTYNARHGTEDRSGVPDDHYAEWDDMDTILSVKDALGENYGNIELVEADENAYEKFKDIRPDLVFNIAEGLHGESRESHIPAMLEVLRIPYTGSAPLTLSLCLNKARAKQILSSSGVPTPEFFVVDSIDELKKDAFEFPMMVKPLYEGSSKGIKNDCLVRSDTALSSKIEEITRAYGQPAIVERFLRGREFTVALIGNGKGARVLPVVEIDYSTLPAGANPIYSYEAKWIYDTPEKPLKIFDCPAKLDRALEREISKTAIDAFTALGVRDWCRIDMRLDEDDVPNIIELNPLPGILPNPEQNSCFPKAARAAGLNFAQMLTSVVEAAKKRYGIA